MLQLEVLILELGTCTNLQDQTNVSHSETPIKKACTINHACVSHKETLPLQATSKFYSLM